MTQIASSHSYLQPRFSGHIVVDEKRLQSAGIPNYIIQELKQEADKFEPLPDVTGYITGDDDYQFIADTWDHSVIVNVTNDPSNPIGYDMKTGASTHTDTQKPKIFDYDMYDQLLRVVRKPHAAVQFLQNLYQQYTGAKPKA